MTDAEREARIAKNGPQPENLSFVWGQLVEARAEIARLQAAPGTSALERANNLRCAPGSVNEGELLLKSWQTVPVARAIEAAEREARAAATQIARKPLVRLLTEARQYVADAGSDEDNETRSLARSLLRSIDRALAAKPGDGG